MIPVHLNISGFDERLGIQEERDFCDGDLKVKELSGELFINADLLINQALSDAEDSGRFNNKSSFKQHWSH